MKKLMEGSRLILFCGILVFTLFSCSQDESLSNEESSVEEISKTRKGKNCNIDLNDMDISFDWDADCSSVSITLSLCCDCLFPGGKETGCTLEPGVLWMQVEVCPFTFDTDQVTIPWYSIPAGSCYEAVFVFDDPGCDVAYISQISFEGENLDFDFNFSDAECP